MDERNIATDYVCILYIRCIHSTSPEMTANSIEFFSGTIRDVIVRNRRVKARVKARALLNRSLNSNLTFAHSLYARGHHASRGSGKETHVNERNASCYRVILKKVSFGIFRIILVFRKEK